jgi:hypothetical protein
VPYKTAWRIVIPIWLIVVVPISVAAILISIFLFPLGLITGPIAAAVVWLHWKFSEWLVFRAARLACEGGMCPICEQSIAVVKEKYRCQHCGAVIALHGKLVVPGRRQKAQSKAGAGADSIPPESPL